MSSVKVLPAISSLTLVLALALSSMAGPVSAYQASEHRELVAKSLFVLNGDNRTYLSKIFHAEDPSGKELIDWFQEGVYDTDRLDLARNHYYNPLTGKGLTEYSSKELCQDLYDNAVADWGVGDYGTSIYYLGRAVHMVMDSTVPHHGHNDPLNGHAEFETWLAAHADRYAVTSGGLYDHGINASDYVHNNAVAVYDHYADIRSSNASDASYANVASLIEPLALRSTAGFVAMFFNDVRGTEPELFSSSLEGGKVRLTWQPAVEENFVRYEVYVSSAGDDIELDAEHLLKTVTSRDGNALTVDKLDRFGSYQFQVVTVLANDRLESSIATEKVGASKLIMYGAAVALVTVIGLTFTLTQSRKKRRI